MNEANQTNTYDDQKSDKKIITISNIEITLSDIVRGIQHSVEALNLTSQNRFENILESFFLITDGIYKPKNFKIQLNDESIRELPLITLIPMNFVTLKNISVEYQGTISNINQKHLKDGMSRASISINNTSKDVPIKIVTEFSNSDPTETYSQLIDILSNEKAANAK